MKNLNVNTIKGLKFYRATVLLALMLVSACDRSEAESPENVYTKTVAGEDGKEIALLVRRNRDEMMCGGKKVVHEAECYLDKYGSPQCLEQKITIHSGDGSKELEPEGHIVKPSKKRLTKYPLWYPDTYEWACQGFDAKHYVVLQHTTGGNCSGCEWATVFDMEGNLIYRPEKSRSDKQSVDRMPKDFTWPDFYKDYKRLSQHAPQSEK